MIENMKALLREKDTCVLATASEDIPHCSLMSYATGEDGREIYLVTHRDTTKHENLTKNPVVSLLIDTREEHNGPRKSEARAMTVDGTCERISDLEKRHVAKVKLLERHPHLRDFIDHPEAVVLCIRVNSFLLLEGVKDAYFIKP